MANFRPFRGKDAKALGPADFFPDPAAPPPRPADPAARKRALGAKLKGIFLGLGGKEA